MRGAADGESSTGAGDDCALICSQSALAASFRPVITVAGAETRALVEQTTVVDPQRLGQSAGRLSASEIHALDEALALILGL